MDRRRAERFDLAVDFCVFVRESDEREFMGRVLNISSLGMKVDMTFEERGDLLALGDTVVVKRFPDVLKDMVSEASGEVVWLGTDLCGVRFFEPLEDAEGDLKDILDQPGLPPYEDNLF